jgi:hypothetical protein
MRHAFEAWHAGALDRMFHHLSAVCANMVAISLSDDRIGGRTVTSQILFPFLYILYYLKFQKSDKGPIYYFFR